MMLGFSVTREEVFDGEKTGSTNITAMRAWLEGNKHPISMNAFQMWNAKDMLEDHEFDETFTPRVNSLLELLEKTGKFEPLILAQDNDGSVFVIDGWHRLAITYKICLQKKMTFCPFPAYVVSMADCKMFPVKGVLVNGVPPLRTK